MTPPRKREPEVYFKDRTDPFGQVHVSHKYAALLEEMEMLVMAACDLPGLKDALERVAAAVPVVAAEHMESLKGRLSRAKARQRSAGRRAEVRTS